MNSIVLHVTIERYQWNFCQNISCKSKISTLSRYKIENDLQTAVPIYYDAFSFYSKQNRVTMKITDEIRISENGFVFNSRTGDSFNLNPTALELTKLIAQGRDFEDIRSVFLEKYNVDELTFEKDFYEFCALIKHYQITTPENPLDFN
jgi:hypothetical protein